jgi:transcriptional regulator with XRE-family HTH domain
MTLAELSEISGVPVRTLSRIESTDRLTSDKAKSLSVALDTSVGYLLHETDNPARYMYASEILPPGAAPGMEYLASEFIAPGIAEPSGSQSPKQRQHVPADLAPLPARRALVRVLPKDFSACCGSGVEWGDVSSVAYDFEYYDPDPGLVNYSPVIAMYVIGDSMEPHIEEGDTVIFTENPSDIDYAPNGSTVLVNYEGRMIVRGLFRKPDRVILKAWNKAYEDIEITLEQELHICGVVLRVDKSMKPPSML